MKSGNFFSKNQTEIFKANFDKKADLIAQMRELNESEIKTHNEMKKIDSEYGGSTEPRFSIVVVLAEAKAQRFGQHLKRSCVHSVEKETPFTNHSKKSMLKT